MLVTSTLILTPIVILAIILFVYREEMGDRLFTEESLELIGGSVIFTFLLVIPALFVTLPIAAWISGDWGWVGGVLISIGMFAFSPWIAIVALLGMVAFSVALWDGSGGW